METSTMQATNGGNMSLSPVTRPARVSVGRGAAAEGADELRNPQVHEIEVAVHARRAVGVRRDDHRLGARLLRHLPYLVPVVVVGGEQDLDVLLPHVVDHLKHVPRRRRDARLGLDIDDAGKPVLTRERVPLLVIASAPLPPHRHPPPEPSPQPPPSGTVALLALSSRAGTHSSRSRPVVTNTSALERVGTKLGFGCT